MFARISSIFIATLAAASLCALSTPAYSAGLGKLTVRSALGQRLNAEIEILSLQPGEFDSLKVQLASSDAFRQAGIEVNPVLSSVRMQVERRDSAAFVRLVSTQPISDPFLDLLIEMQWSAGRLVREYTFLLDPPGYAGRNVIAAVPADRPIAAGPAAGASTTGVVSEPALGIPSEPVQSSGGTLASEGPATGSQQTIVVPPEAERAPSAGQSGSVVDQRAIEERPLEDGVRLSQQTREPAQTRIREYEVAKGDTLGGIAKNNLHSGVSLNQMMIALYRENPEAFLRRNINLVRAGRILTIPDRDAVASIDSREAQRLVLSHHAEFDQYRRLVAERAMRGAPLAESGGRTSGGRIEQQAEAPPASVARDEVRLSKLDPAKPSAAAARAAHEDEIAARDRAVKEAQSRVSDLEKNVTDLRKLLELKNQQLAELEKRAAPRASEPQKPAAAVATQSVPQPSEPKPATPVPKPPPPSVVTPQASVQRDPIATPPAAKTPEPQKPVPPVQVPAAAQPPQQAGPTVAPAPGQQAQVPQPTAPKSQAAPAGSTAPRAADPAQQGFLDEFTDSPYALPGAGLVVLAVGLYGFVAWKRRRASVAQFQDSIMSSQSKVSSSSIFTPAGQQAVGPSSVVLPSVSQGNASRVETDEVDPIAEAEVYMAYGRDAQAEEILNEAVAKDPSRASYHLKLLEIYSNRRDTRAFEQGARKIKDITGGSGPEWENAISLGRALDPANALYGGAGQTDGDGAAPAMEGAPALDVDLNAASGGAAAPDLILGGPSAAEDAADSASSGLDFDLGGGSGETSASGMTDFSPGGTLIVDAKDVAPPAGSVSAAAEPSGAASGALDFDLGGVGDAPKPEAGGLDFELPADSGAVPPATTEMGAAAPGGGESAASGGLEFDMKFDVGESAADLSVAPMKEDPPAVDLTAISLDLGSADASSSEGGAGSDDPKWQEVATKLDLAKAYVEMGEKTGASELLNEVLRDGDAAQRSQAEELLAKIG